MRVLLACEESGVVRDEFGRLGHDSWSCDIVSPESKKGPHIMDDIRRVLFGMPVRLHGWSDLQSFDPDGWDFIGCHPPCTHLSVSGAGKFKEKKADGRQREAIDFFMGFVYFFENHPRIKGYIEQPVSIMSTLYRKPDQYIQPYDFGERESKKTCLWLFNLPKLIGSGIPGPPKNDAEKKEYAKVWRASPGPNRSRDRSRTRPGIARAFAEQWGGRVLQAAI